MNPQALGVAMARPCPLPFTGLSRKRRSFFYTQLARMLSAGLSPVRALTTLAEQRGSWRLSRAARDMVAHIQSGGTLAEAFARHPTLFPENEVRMIEAAEHGGAAPETMLRIARFLDTVRTFWLRFITGLIYPAMVVLVALMGVPLLIAIFLGDPVAVLYAQLRAGAILLGAILVATTAWRFFSSLSWPRVAIHGILLGIPVFGGLARRIATARFADVFECLYSAGVRVPEAMARAAMACGNAVIGRRLLRAVPRVLEGTPISAALAQTGVVPLLGISMVEVGEVAGKLDESLRKFAQYQQEDAEVTIDRLAKLLPMLIYGLVVVYMVFMILRFATSYVGAIERQLH